VYILRGVYLKTIIPMKERSIWSLPHKERERSNLKG